MTRTRFAVLVLVLLAATGGTAWAAFVATTSNAGNSFAAAAAFSGYREEVLADSPAGYWRLGETSGTVASDQTANSNTGTYTNGPTLGQPGALLEDPNTAVSFDGSNDYVSVPDSASLDVGDTVTLEAWVKRGSTGSDSSIIEKDAHYELYFAADDKLTLREPGTGDIAESTRTVRDTQWHHVVATKSGSTARLYIDGADVTGKVTNQTLANNANPLTIGRTPYFSGSIDEVAVYSTALNASRVKAHYRAGRPYHGEVLLDDPTAYWRLGETAGNTTVAFDSKGTSHGVANTGATLGQAGGLLGYANTATAFNGTSGRVEVPNSAIPAVTGSFSIEAWVKPNALTGTQFLVNKDTTYYLYLIGSDIIFGYRSGGAYLFARANGAATVGSWQHFVGSYNGSTVSLYRNGVLIASPAFTGAVDALSGNLFIGTLSAAGSFFNGTLDEVALYRSALSAARVQAHYEAGRPFREEVLGDNPVSYWRLAETGEGVIGHRASSSAALTASGTSLTINKPSGVVQGDVMVAAIQESGGTGGTLTAPSGWTPIRTQTVISGGGSAADTKGYTYYKVAESSEPTSYTWGSTLSAEHSGGIIALTGVNTSSPIDDSASQENAASLSVTCPAVTTTVDESWLVAFPFTHDGTTFSFPSGTTERFDVQTGTASTDRTIAGGTDPLGAAGDTGTRTITNQNPGGFAAPTSACITVALEPALGTAYDYQHANHGSYGGGVTLRQAGALAGDGDDAALLDGSTGYVSVPDSSSLDLGDGPFTMEAWIKRGSTATDDDIVQKGTNAYRLYVTATTGKLALRKEGVADIVQSTTAILDTTTWHHVVATKTGAATKLYIDGADVTGTVTNQTLVDTTSALLIGGSGTGFFNGSIDELAVYDTVLTPAQVALHYAEGRG
jgi:hypothetical protein